MSALPEPLPRRRIARAMTRPSGFVAAGIGFGASVLAVGLPAGLIVGAGVGALAWGTRVALAIPWGQRHSAMDPFTVQEPWRRFVIGAQRAERRFEEATRRLDAGPLQDRMEMLGHRVRAATAEAWRTARAGQELSSARRQIDAPSIRRQLGELEESGEGEHARARVEALRAQLASAERMDSAIAATEARLGLLDAQLGEAVTRAIELSAGGTGTDPGSLGAGLDQLIDEMEALRRALSETGPPELE